MAVGCPSLQIYYEREIIVGITSVVAKKYRESEEGRTIGTVRSCAVSRDMI